MALDKGKRKRAHRNVDQSQIAETSEAGRASTPEAPPAKRTRHKAETQVCPVCHEKIPLRLLGKHADLEDSRLNEIISHVGSTEPFLDLNYESYASTSALPSTSAAAAESGSASTSRRSAVRARQSILQKTAPIRSQSTTVTKVLQTIKRNRKNRHGKLRDMTREDDENYTSTHLRLSSSRREFVCPVCSTAVGGDEDVQDAHLDACIADESRKMEEERVRREMQQREEAEDVDIDDFEDDGDAGGHVGDVTGMGFNTRNQNDLDIEDDIDIDGDDAEVFGDAQFNEGDILGIGAPAPVSASARTRPTSERDAQAGGVTEACPEQEEEEEPEKVLRVLIAESRQQRQSSTPCDDSLVSETDKVDVAILAAKRKKDQNALVMALEKKVKLLESNSQSSTSSPNSNPSLCRICLDQYNEPTVSTGCWHTCCRECWLRCLGSTKLCPICKRITAAMDLRRVYL